jgi:putative protein-disulfide isomerase
MDKVLHYLFDPLCGWCYGATRAVADLDVTPKLTVSLLPTGLFSGDGSRPMDDAFAAYAWANDERIARLTGQSFTEPYRERVLGDRQRLFDSGPATLALTAVSLTDPSRELDALKAIQRARYVDGRDVTELETLATLLRALGLEKAAAMIEQSDAPLLVANRARIARSQALMQEFGARGVPTFIFESGTERRMLHSSEIFSNPHALTSQLSTA